MAASRFLLASLFFLAVRTSAFVEFDRSFVITSIDINRGSEISITNLPGQYYAYATFSSAGPVNQDFLENVTIVGDAIPNEESEISILKLHSKAPLTNSQGGLGRVTLTAKQGGSGIKIRNTNPNSQWITPTQAWVVYIVDVNLNKCPVYDTHGVMNVLMSTRAKDCPNTATILNADPGFSLSKFSVRAEVTWDVFTAPADVQNDNTKVLHIPSSADSYSSFTNIACPIATVVAHHDAREDVPIKFSLSSIRNYNRTVGKNAVFSVSSPGFASLKQEYAYAWADSEVPPIQEFAMSGTASLRVKVRGMTTPSFTGQSISVGIGALSKQYNGIAISDMFDSPAGNVTIKISNGGDRLPRYAIQVEQSS